MSKDELNQGAEQEELSTFDASKFLEEKYSPMLEENEFHVLVPKTRFQYFVDNKDLIERHFETYKLKFHLNKEKMQVFVTTTPQTFDPTSVLIARQMLRLVARYVDLPVALKIFRPLVESEIIDIDKCAKPETFLKRRERFIGNNRQTLTALELLTNTNMQCYGSTLCVIGAPRGIQLVMRIANDCFAKNVLPSFWIKTLMIRRELEKMPEMADQDWSLFMPKLKKSSSRRKKHAYVPKAPAEERGIPDIGKFCVRKEDLQMERGEGGFKKPRAERGRRFESRPGRGPERRK